MDTDSLPADIRAYNALHSWIFADEDDFELPEVTDYIRGALKSPSMLIAEGDLGKNTDLVLHYWDTIIDELRDDFEAAVKWWAVD